MVGSSVGLQAVLGVAEPGLGVGLDLGLRPGAGLEVGVELGGLAEPWLEWTTVALAEPGAWSSAAWAAQAWGATVSEAALSEAGLPACREQVSLGPELGAAVWWGQGPVGAPGPVQKHWERTPAEPPDFETAILGVALRPLGLVQETLYDVTTFSYRKPLNPHRLSK